MYPTKASPPAGIDFFCPEENLFLYLEKLHRGSSLPENVIADVNPFQHMPSNLPDGVWFFVRAGEKACTSFGFWKIKGEACNLFSNQFITGWQTTFEYYEGQAPHAIKTNWMMHEYWIVHRKILETSKTKEASSLFRVFLGDEVKQNDHKMQKMFASNIVAEENQILSKQSAVGSENYTETFGSTSSLQASKDEGPVQLRAERKLLDHHNLNQENVDESDCLSSGDFLALDDLEDNPPSRTSSENSSCLTMSSDERFDSLDLLQEIEHEINRDLVRRDASCKSTYPAPLRLHESFIPHPSYSVNSGKIVEENWNRRIQKEQPLNRPRDLSGDSSNSGASSSGDPITDGEKKVNSGKIVEENWNRRIKKEQPLNRPRDLSGDSSNSGASSSGDPITDGEKKGKRAKKRHRKFLCFIPF